jgi:hypothetical protein
VLTRLMASCALVFLATVGGYAQERPDGPLPGQEGPPAQQDRPSPQPDTRPPQQEPPARQPEPQQPRADVSPSRGDRCGAVAYTADGAFGAAYGMENCSDAERLAIDECRRESTDKDDCTRGAIVRQDSWFYVQFCRNGSEWTTHVTTKQTLVDVNNSAADWANRSKYGAQNCRLVPNGLFHSAGLHTKM